MRDNLPSAHIAKICGDACEWITPYAIEGILSRSFAVRELVSFLQMQSEKLIKLDYHDCWTEHGDVRLASSPDALDDLRISVFKDTVLRDGEPAPVGTGLSQVHLTGTPQALQELGRYLIAISELPDLPREFVSHLCPVPGGENAPDVHLIVHQRFEANPTVSVQIGDTIETDVDS